MRAQWNEDNTFVFLTMRKSFMSDIIKSDFELDQ